MKVSLVALLGVVGGSTPAEAKCACTAWLLTEQVTEGKPYVVVQASCASKAATIALVDPSGAPVPATVVTTHEGYNGSFQYVFSPDRALAPGKHQLTITDRGTKTLDLAVVAATPSASPPSWTGTAKVLAQEQREYGCGPSKSVDIQAGADASLAFVELVDAAKQRTSGYVKVDKGSLHLGHGMCSGAFPLVRGRGYTATITLLAPERGTSSSSKTVSFTYAP